MSDTDLIRLRRAVSFSDGSSIDTRAKLLKEKIRARVSSKLSCNSCNGSGKEKSFRIIGYEERPRIYGLICCCGSDEKDGEHGYYGIENYTHSFVHMCDYYDTECGCETEEIMEDVPIRTNSCEFCDGAGFSRFDKVVPILAYCGDEAARLLESIDINPDSAARQWKMIDDAPFERWLLGLERYGKCLISQLELIVTELYNPELLPGNSLSIANIRRLAHEYGDAKMRDVIKKEIVLWLYD